MSKRSGKSEPASLRAAVRLVSMPFKSLEHPPIQLGILQRCLEQAGIPSRSHSLELAFMDYLHAKTGTRTDADPVTIAHYQRVANREFAVHLGDWVFNVPPFVTAASTDEAYLAHIRTLGVADEAIAIAVRMRKLVPGFLTAAADELLADAPRVIGFSTVFQQNVASLVLARILKARDPSVTIVFGGGNCDGPMGQALHESFPWVDCVVRGEGERVFVQVVEDIVACRPIRPQPGLCYRANGRSVVVAQAIAPLVPMEEVPTPAYDDYFERLEHTPLRSELWPEVAILFESSRGCWWGEKHHCTFCGLNASSMKFRSKPTTRVADEIVGLAKRYGVLDFVAVDDIIDLHHVRELFPLLRTGGADFTLFYETKANLTKGQVWAFHAAGVNTIQPGIESLSTPILQLMRKGVTALQNVRLLKWCAEIGVLPLWNLLYGFPGEPPEEYERMCDLVPSLVHLEPPTLSRMAVDRFSPYFDRPADFGIELVGPQPHYRFLYRIDPEALGNLAYDFAYRYVDGRDPSTYIGSLSAAIQRWRDVAKGAAGTLSYKRGPGFLLVRDRRPGFDSADYRFDGIEARIFLAADAGATPGDIRTALAAEGDDDLTADEIESYLQDLVDARLMFREGNRFLALAIAARSRERVAEQSGIDVPRTFPVTLCE